MYKITIAPSAKKQLKKIKKIYQEGINSALQEIKEDPNLSKPLSRELTGKFTFHVGVYRIIYKVNQGDKVVTILNVGPRSAIYSR